MTDAPRTDAPLPPVDQLVCRRTTRDEAERVAALIRSVQPDNAKADLDVMRWQYWDNPYGEVSSWVVEVPDGPLLGHFMNFPVEGLVDGGVVPMGKGGDMLTVESARGMGVASRLTTATYQDMGTRGYANTFATPNGMSRGAATRGGMDLLGQLPLWLRPLDDGWLAGQVPGLSGAPARAVARAARAVAFRPRTTARGDIVDAVPDDVDDLWAAAVALEPTTNRIVHDGRWWRWRYSRPGTPYRLLAATRSGRTVALAATVVREAFDAPVLHVLDVIAETAADGAALVEAATRTHARDVVAVAGVGIRGTALARMLSRAGLRSIPPRFHPKPSFMGFTRNSPGSTDITTRAWSISWADFDHL